MRLKTKAFLCAAIVSIAGSALAQSAITSAPPQLAANLDAFVKAFNSSDPQAWEATAQRIFTPALLKNQTPAARQQVIADARRQFGAIVIQGVERHGGRTAPLQLHVKGTAASGVFHIEVDDVFRFNSFASEVVK